MIGLRILKSILIGGASVLTLVHPAAAKLFDVPEGDLATALGTYMRQSGVEIIYLNDVVRGHKSRGAKGDYTETAALDQILRGTGFTTLTTSSSTIDIVPQQPKPVKQLAQAVRRAPAAPMPAAPVGIETVVVTAQKKTENIQQVPIAITALSQAQLTERQIAGGPDLVKEVPNLTFSKTNFSGYNLEIRGVGTQAISVTTDPAVAIAFNGIPFIRNHFFEQEFYDLDNLEVLRGPQGTLYGRNATGGVVNILSAKPTDTYEAMLSADIGNYSNRRLEGMINLPIVGDTLDLRIAGEWTKRDGYDEDTELDTSVDGRDLWSGRMTLGWKPASNVQTYFVWEHFSEDDDRLRSGKQLCKTAPIPAEVGGVAVPPLAGDVADIADYLSQGCEDTSLYSPDAFEVPNGYSLTYYAPLADANVPTKEDFNVYGETTQSTNLRDIESAVLPEYRAKNDTLEFNADWTVTPALTFTSQTGYNQDFLWSTEDYNRFDSTPGAFTTAGGIFCDPQLGCSDRLVLQDLSTEHAWQLSQEFRLASDFKGPLNFSVGGNYLHYETVEDYYVFVNSLSLLAEALVPAVLPGQTCEQGSFKYTIYTNPQLEQPSVREGLSGCDYVDPNPLSSVNGEGHNYFLSENPYVLNSYAMFGEAYYDLTNDLKLTAGARWTDDQKHFDIIPSELLIPGYGYPETGTTDQQWDQWTGRFVADWTPQTDFTDQTLVYFSASHGYKAGGANPPGAFYPGIGAGFALSAQIMPDHPLTFGPEFIEAFELGTKNTLLDSSLTLNGDIFYYNYTGYQISEIVDRTAITQNFNSHMEGAEFETNWEPIPGLKFSLAQGLENSALAGGDEGIDLMDRTAGNPNWIVVKPYVTESSNCILPTYVVAAVIQQGGAENDIGNYLCQDAYGVPHLDPITGLPFVPNPTVVSPPGAPPPPPGYIGFNPATAPNNGEGFYKNLAGNQVPNAPHFTTSLTAEYTIPVSDDWAATLHGDFYWQSQQWARVFEDPIDKIHGYSTTNVSLILTSDNGWQVMAYVKNVFDVTAITGTFLNSDDSGLTTNVFLTDPRLFGIRVTKHLDQNDGFWGTDYSGYDFFTGLFSDTDNGKPSLWVTLGGQLSALEDAQQLALPFVPDYGGGKSPLEAEEPPRFGFDEDAKISFQPDESDWVFSGSIQFGRASADRHQHLQTANKNIPISTTRFSRHYSLYPTHHVKFSDNITSQSEAHAIVDFLVGKDVGLGMFGLQGFSIVSGGVRIAQFSSQSNIDLRAEPDVQYYPKTLPKTFPQFYQFIRRADIHFHDYAQTAAQKESFHGFGPKLDWSASTPISGNDTDNGEIALDWGANMSVLFGRQKARVQHQTAVNSYYLKSGNFSPGPGYVFRGPHNLKDGSFYNRPWCRSNDAGGGGLYTDCRTHAPPTAHHTNAASHKRSRLVAVPNVGALFGLSYKYRNAKVSFGYRADEFFGAMDGGIDVHKSENRGFNGPFASISIGFGG
jgi:iron complex outermembrane receptor protein